MKRKKLFIIIPALLALLFYLLWPLKSSTYKIEENTEALAQKSAFINSVSIHTRTDKPTILLITVDDLGMADVSLYNEGSVSTPNIDRLGGQGVVFENAYVTSPVCAPSRAAIITGRYQQRFGFEFTMHERYLQNRLEYLGFRYFIDSHPWKAQWANKVPDSEAIHQQGLPVSEISLADALKRHG